MQACKGSKAISHIPGMKPDNFMFHAYKILGLQNRDKQSKLDVGNLKLWCTYSFMSFLSTLFLNLDANQVAQNCMTRIIQNWMIDYEDRWLQSVGIERPPSQSDQWKCNKCSM